MTGRLARKVCVVTGAATGLGASIAQSFRAEGAIVEGWDLSTGPGAQTQVDVTDEVAVAMAFADVVDRWGRIDVLVNNAGILPPEDGSILDGSSAVWRKVFEVNVIGTMICCKHGIPPMIATGRGSVVNVSSLAAVSGSAVSQAGYTASKGAVLSLSRELAVEFADRGVRVNALCPGPVGTEMTRGVYARERGGGSSHRMSYLPMGRLAEPTEVANAALFLASDESTYVSGTTFLVDGAAHAAYVATTDVRLPDDLVREESRR